MYKNKWLFVLILISGPAAAGQGWHCSEDPNFEVPEITILNTSVTMNGKVETAFYTDAGSYREWSWGANPANPRHIRYQFMIESNSYQMNVNYIGMLYENISIQDQTSLGYFCKRFE